MIHDAVEMYLCGPYNIVNVIMEILPDQLLGLYGIYFQVFLIFIFPLNLSVVLSLFAG